MKKEREDVFVSFLNSDTLCHTVTLRLTETLVTEEQHRTHTVPTDIELKYLQNKDPTKFQFYWEFAQPYYGMCKTVPKIQSRVTHISYENACVLLPTIRNYVDPNTY
jgi:hypothetical protein